MVSSLAKVVHRAGVAVMMDSWLLDRQKKMIQVSMEGAEPKLVVVVVLQLCEDEYLVWVLPLIHASPSQITMLNCV